MQCVVRVWTLLFFFTNLKREKQSFSDFSHSLPIGRVQTDTVEQCVNESTLSVWYNARLILDGIIPALIAACAHGDYSVIDTCASEQQLTH